MAAQWLLKPAVDGRVGSSRCTISDKKRATFPPLASSCSRNSFPMLHIITQGWFLSRWIKSVKSVSAHWSKKRLYPFTHLPNFHSSKASTWTSIPILSHKSSNSTDDGLWLVRIALQPISFNISICRSVALQLTAAPKGPKSWCMRAPFILRLSPFKKKPLSLSNFNVRKPKFVW